MIHNSHPKGSSVGIIGFKQLSIKCIIGILPQERKTEQELLISLKVRLNLSNCHKTGEIKDTVDYVQLAAYCSALARQKNYFLLETYARDIIDSCIEQFGVQWAWVCIEKPAAISTAQCAFVELERT